MKQISLLLLGMMFVASFSACSDDDDKYQSQLPIFSDISFSEERICIDQKVTATAVQNQKGVLLDRTEYEWSADMYVPDDSTMSYVSGVLYTKNSTNPTCTFQTPHFPGKK